MEVRNDFLRISAHTKLTAWLRLGGVQGVVLEGHLLCMRTTDRKQRLVVNRSRQDPHATFELDVSSRLWMPVDLYSLQAAVSVAP